MKEVYQKLNELGIEYTVYEHHPVYTVAEADQVLKAYPDLQKVGHTKNLFLRNKKGDAQYLLIADAHSAVDLKNVQDKLGESRLSFASPERLMRYLGVTPGSVSVFSLLNDTDRLVTVLLDEKLLPNDKLGFHPNDNTATVVIASEDLVTFLQKVGYEPIILLNGSNNLI